MTVDEALALVSFFGATGFLLDVFREKYITHPYVFFDDFQWRKWLYKSIDQIKHGLDYVFGKELISLRFFVTAITLSMIINTVIWILLPDQFGERSEGADEIYIWIPQVAVALGSTIFFVCVLHNFILLILKRNGN